MSLEKAWNVGDEKQYQGVTWYVGGFNAKGQPLWRKKKDGSGVSDKNAVASGKKDGNGEKKTIDDHASGASTDALKRAASDKNAKPEVREAAKKELEKRNDGTKQKKTDKQRMMEITNRQKEINELKGHLEFAKRNGKKDDVEKFQKEIDDIYNDDKYVDKSIKVQSKPINHLFAESLKKRDLQKILKETGNSSDVYAVDYASISNDGKFLEIHGRGSGRSSVVKEIPLNTNISETLTQTYSDFSKNVDKILNNDEPEHLSKEELNNSIDVELKNFWGNNNTHNDSPEWREGAYAIYKKYNKNNPMSVEAFDRGYASSYQGASQGLKMEYYFKARENGGNEKEAEDYANQQYNAYVRQLQDPALHSAPFKETPFSKGNETEYVSVRSLIDSINMGKV